MLPPDPLLELITYLQSDLSVKHGRHVLLDYVRKNTRAPLGLLFIVDKERQVLTLLERCGRHPRNLVPAGGEYSQDLVTEELDRRPIPLHGLFGQVLHTQGLLYLQDIHSDTHSLKEEQYWAWPDGAVVLGALGSAGNHRGVLVLCFAPVNKQGQTQTALDERHLLICIALLAAYFSGPTKDNEIPIAIIDQERNRIARDLHDGVAQQIAHAMHKLQYIQHIFEQQPQVALREIVQVNSILRRSLNELRQSIMSFIPIQLGEQGFDASLKALIAEYATNEPDLAIHYETNTPNSLPSSLEVPIFRFIQEALTNIHKHAQASEVSIHMQILSGLLLVEIRDNGKGFLPGQGTPGVGQQLGLRAMRERIEEAGGHLELWSNPGEGTLLKARFPLAASLVMLTEREREVLRLLVEGSTNRAIAQQLSVSIETVKSHVHHIMQKLHAKDRTQAAVIATKKRWL